MPGARAPEGRALNVLLIILILLVVTRTFAELAKRAKLPALVGELVAGIFLGSLLLKFQDLVPTIWLAANGELFAGLADLGMFFLMLLAGIRMEPLDFARSSKSAILIALGGMLVPVCAGFGLGIRPQQWIRRVAAEKAARQATDRTGGIR